MPAKYAPLARYLVAQPGDRVTLTLAQIEAIIDAPLPPRAQQASFWTSTRWGDGPTWAWRNVGWRVAERRYQYPTWVVSFVRDAPRPAGPS